MTHDEIRDRLGEYAVGAMGPEEGEEAAAHVRSCAACAADVEELRDLEARLEALPLRAERGPRPAPRFGWVGVLAAAAMLVTIGLVIALRPTAATAPAQEGAEQAKKMAAGLEEIERSFREIARATEVPELAPLTARLEELRRACASFDRRLASDAVEARRRLGAVRKAVLAVEMLTWSVTERERWERVKPEYGADEWREIERVYFGATVTPSEVAALTERFLDRGREEVGRLAGARLGPDPADDVAKAVASVRGQKSCRVRVATEGRVGRSDPVKSEAEGLWVAGDVLFLRMTVSGGAVSRVVRVGDKAWAWHEVVEDWVTAEELSMPTLGRGFKNPADLLSMLEKRLPGSAAAKEGVRLPVNRAEFPDVIGEKGEGSATVRSADGLAARVEWTGEVMAQKATVSGEASITPENREFLVEFKTDKGVPIPLPREILEAIARRPGIPKELKERVEGMLRR
jgi:hypothetical protein